MIFMVLGQLRVWLRAVLLRRRLDGEMRDEMESHLARSTERLMRRGLSAEAARRAAEREFGNIVQFQEQGRDARGARWIHDFMSDIGYGWRALRHSPAFAVVAVLTIGLGMGGSLAMFALADAVVLRTLPVPSPEELVLVKTGRPGAPPGGAPSYPAYERIRARSQTLGGVAAFGSGDHLPLVVDGQPEQVFGQLASGNYFDLLGVKPLLGRLLTAADERLVPAVAVVSQRYWQHRFGGRPDILGTVVHYDGLALTIVGVTPPSYGGLEPSMPVDITMPITIAGFGLIRDPTASWFDLIARLKPSVTIEHARAEVDAIYQGFLADHDISSDRPGAGRVQLVAAAHGLGRLRAQLARPIVLLLALVGAVLAIACANIANLLLARTVTRQRELAIRSAIGASRTRIVRQLITESVLLFILGSLAGLVLAATMTSVLADFLAVGRLPIVLDLKLGARTLLFTGALCLLTGVFSGFLPAIRAARTDTFADLRLRSSYGPGSLSRLLVVFQIAASIAILVDGSLLVRTLRNLKSLDPGFRSPGVLTLSVRDLAAAPTTTRRDRLWRDIVSRIDQLAGVHSASISVLTPLSGRDRTRGIEVPGFQPLSPTDRDVRFNYVSPGYFETFGVPLRSGRPFEWRDDRGTAGVVLINEATARFYFGARSPVGQRIILATAPPSAQYEIIGVVEDTKHRNLREAAERFVYLPMLQSLDDPTRVTLAFRATGDPLTLLPAVRREIASIDHEVLLSDVMTLDRQLDQSLLRERLLSTLSTAFAALALLLATIGLYGLMSYSVLRRRNEIGVRMALGATGAAIRQSMLQDAIALVALGTLIGLPLGLFVARTLRALLFGVSTTDPAAVAAGVSLMAFVAGVAAYIPARRAARIDPMRVLTSD